MCVTVHQRQRNNLPSDVEVDAGVYVIAAMKIRSTLKEQKKCSRCCTNVFEITNANFKQYVVSN